MLGLCSLPNIIFLIILWQYFFWTILGVLQASMDRQGVTTTQKGCCGACDKPIVGQVITALGRTWHPEVKSLKCLFFIFIFIYNPPKSKQMSTKIVSIALFHFPFVFFFQFQALYMQSLLSRTGNTKLFWTRRASVLWFVTVLSHL